MYSRILLTFIWLSFISYAFVFAPPSQPDTTELILNLSNGNWEGINPLIISLFNLMGIWPIIYACVVLIDGRGQKIPAWLFSGLSFAVGAFALLPYLMWRDDHPEFPGKTNLLIKILDSRILGISLLIGASILVWFGLSEGDWQSFLQSWQSSRFINVMSLDFCILTLLFPVLVKDDLARRKVEQTWPLFSISFLPLLGPLLYLCLRPNLPTQ